MGPPRPVDSLPSVQHTRLPFQLLHRGNGSNEGFPVTEDPRSVCRSPSTDSGRTSAPAGKTTRSSTNAIESVVGNAPARGGPGTPATRASPRPPFVPYRPGSHRDRKGALARRCLPVFHKARKKSAGVSPARPLRERHALDVDRRSRFCRPSSHNRPFRRWRRASGPAGLRKGRDRPRCLLGRPRPFGHRLGRRRDDGPSRLRRHRPHELPQRRGKPRLRGRRRWPRFRGTLSTTVKAGIANRAPARARPDRRGRAL